MEQGTYRGVLADVRRSRSSRLASTLVEFSLLVSTLGFHCRSFLQKGVGGSSRSSKNASPHFRHSSHEVSSTVNSPPLCHFPTKISTAQDSTNTTSIASLHHTQNDDASLQTLLDWLFGSIWGLLLEFLVITNFEKLIFLPDVGSA